MCANKERSSVAAHLCGGESTQPASTVTVGSVAQFAYERHAHSSCCASREAHAPFKCGQPYSRSGADRADNVVRSAAQRHTALRCVTVKRKVISSYLC